MPVNVGLYYRQRFSRDFSFSPTVPADPDAVQTFTTEGGIYELAGTLAYAPKPFLALALGYHFLIGRERTIESTTFNQNSSNGDLFNGQNLKGDTLSPAATAAILPFHDFSPENLQSGRHRVMATTLDRTLNRSITNLSSDEKTTDTRDLLGPSRSGAPSNRDRISPWPWISRTNRGTTLIPHC